MSKHSDFKQFRLAQVHSVVQLDPYRVPNQVLPCPVSVKLGAMAMKECSTFTKLQHY